MKRPHQTWTNLIDAPKGRRLTPALDFANEIINLSGPQLVALNSLLKEFEEHPRITRAESYLQAAERRINRGDGALTVREKRELIVGILNRGKDSKSKPKERPQPKGRKIAPDGRDQLGIQKGN